jgi:hypothetical protein
MKKRLKLGGGKEVVNVVCEEKCNAREMRGRQVFFFISSAVFFFQRHVSVRYVRVLRKVFFWMLE